MKILHWVILVALFLSAPAFGVTAQQQSTFNNANTYGTAQESKLKGISTTTSNNTVPGYKTNNPPQTSYYNNPSQFNTDANNAATTNSTETYITNSFSTRPSFVIDRNNDPMLQKTDSVEANPTSVTGLLTNTYSGCNSVTNTGNCVPLYSNQTCDETIKTMNDTCYKTDNVTVTVKESCTPGSIIYSGTLTWPLLNVSGANSGVYHSANLVITCGSTDIINVSVYEQLWVNGYYFGTTDPWVYAAAKTFNVLNGPITWRVSSNLNTYTTSPDYGIVNWYYGLYMVPTCSASTQTCTMAIQPAEIYDYSTTEPAADIASYNSYATTGWCTSDDYQNPANWNAGSSWVFLLPNTYSFLNGYVCYPSIASQTISYPLPGQYPTITGEAINDGCSTLESLTPTQCTLDTNTCTDGPSTKVINGLSVTRNCWQWTDTYTCSAGPADNNCAPLRTAGCGEISSSCLYAFSNGECSVASELMRCPENNCAVQTQMLCGNQTYCINGSCINQTTDSDTGFASASSDLAALDAASTDFNTTTLQIFTGQPMTCTIDLTGYNNCCTVTGWGQVISTASCTTEEDQLAQYRGAGMCHYVGQYCSKSISCVLCTTCTQNTDSYCCFSSMLARIIQEQGRVQLGMGWGTAQSPSCQGFTPTQLSEIDFSKIDFSEYYSSLNTTTNSTNSQTATRVQQHITAITQ